MTWICGSERILIEEVVDAIRTRLAIATDLDYITHHGGSQPDRDLWAHANQHPLDPDARRLVLARQADQIKFWDPLPGWLERARTLPGVHLVFVSDDSDPPYRVQGRRRVLPAHLAVIKPPRGQLVRCSLPNGPDAIAWAQRRAPLLDEATAKYLLIRCGGDLACAAAVCEKIRHFDRVPTRGVIDALCTEAPADSLVDSLLHLDKRRALSAIPGLAHDDYGKVFAQLDQRLDLMAVLWRALRAGQNAREVTAAPVFLARQFMPAAKHYDPDRCANNRRLLAVLDDAHRLGARTGLLESLVALW